MSEIVISGISGKFPMSDDIEVFKRNLFEKVYLVGDPENRVDFKLSEDGHNYGLMTKVEKFDFEAFDRLPIYVANYADPQSRIAIEKVHEAIIDAGISPTTLKGSRTGVYVGCYNLDSLQHWMFNHENGIGLAGFGNYGFSLSNRISYMYDFKGPSMTIDSACSSSMSALNLAFKDLKGDSCDSAIVIGTNLILNPFNARDFSV